MGWNLEDLSYYDDFSDVVFCNLSSCWAESLLQVSTFPMQQEANWFKKGEQNKNLIHI